MARHKAHGLDFARPGPGARDSRASPERRALGVKRHAPRLAAHQRGIFAFRPLTVVGPGRLLALLWQILSGAGFPNQFFCDSWVVGLWRGRPWVAGHRIGRRSLNAFSSRFWLGWVTRRGDKCVRSTCRG